MWAYFVVGILLAAGCQATNEGRAIAFFSMNGVSGPVILTRNGTHMLVDASNLNLPDSAIGSNLAVDIHRVSILIGASGSPCSESSIGGHYNPTNSAMPVGDLSGAMDGQTLNGQTKRFAARTNLTLFGANGIVGRSLALRNASATAGPGEAPVVACANIVHTMTSTAQPCGILGSQNSKTTVEAVFNGRISGRIVFRGLKTAMPMNGTRGVSITSHLFYTDNSNTSVGHPWYIHNYTTDGVNCSTVGARAQAFLDSNSITIASTSAGVAGRQVHSAGVMMQLMDLRTRSIAIRALSMSGGPGPIIACAPLRMVHQRSYVANFGSEGTVTVRQNSEFSSSEVEIDLANTPTQLSINNVQTSQSGSTCGTTAGGGTFNPFNMATRDGDDDDMSSMKSNKKTPDMYPTGDLLGKHNKTKKSNKCDSSLSLFGSNSVARRSVTVVIGTRRMCANLAEKLESGDKTMTAKAVFSTGGDVRGTVYLRQVRHSDGSMGITTVDSTGLMNMDGATSMDHNYHVHVNRKGYHNSAMACGAPFAAGHYNPFNVDVNGTYSADCNPENQLRCEVGDTSKKSGTINLDNSAFLRQDTFMPLMGGQSVMGRSFVIHAAGKGASRVACANIIPMSAFDTQIGVKTSKLNGAFNATRFAQRVRLSSSLASGVSVLYTNSHNDTASNCTYISAAVDGVNAETVANTLSTANLGDEFTQSRTECTEGVSFAQLSSASTLSFTFSVLIISLFAALLLSAPY